MGFEGWGLGIAPAVALLALYAAFALFLGVGVGGIRGWGFGVGVRGYAGFASARGSGFRVEVGEWLDSGQGWKLGVLVGV